MPYSQITVGKIKQKVMKTFFRKLSLLLLGAMVIGALISCEEVPELSECERQNTGTFIIKNETGRTARVDVDNIEEKIISNNGRAYYYNVPAGSRRLYIDIGNGWQYNVEYLNQCETLTYRWYLSTSKGTDQLRLDISRDGVTNTISDFERTTEK